MKKPFKSYCKFLILGSSLVLLNACKKDEIVVAPDPALKPGGATTVEYFYSDAFEQPCPNLSSLELSRHLDANRVFENIFVSAGSSINPGLGPVFNQNSCVRCHSRNGRAAFPEHPETDLGGLLFRLSVPGQGQHGEPAPLPGFGGQLQQNAIFGVQPEAAVSVQFETELRTFLDGQSYTLRKPVFSFTNPYLPLPADIESSPRIAPPVLGLGLLEFIPESDILRREDPNDQDGDAISGRANRVWDAVHNKSGALGRFGWKAGQPSLIQQVAAAFEQDMGLTSWVFPQESSAGQLQYDGLNDDAELSAEELELATYYSQSLAVPAPRQWEQSDVAAGRKLFESIGCGKCHVPAQRTGAAPDRPFLADQSIYPYTDLLLHDMGEDLADHRPEFAATGREWRTPPLWGIGLTPLVNGHSNYLHDGRARSLLEAVLWHGGEAEAQRKKVEALSEEERGQLIRFLEAL